MNLFRLDSLNLAYIPIKQWDDSFWGSKWGSCAQHVLKAFHIYELWLLDDDIWSPAWKVKREIILSLLVCVCAHFPFIFHNLQDLIPSEPSFSEPSFFEFPIYLPNPQLNNGQTILLVAKQAHHARAMCHGSSPSAPCGLCSSWRPMLSHSFMCVARVHLVPCCHVEVVSMGCLPKIFGSKITE